MSKFEVIRGVEGCCLALDDTRIAGPKPWGGGTVIHTWETDKTYKAIDAWNTCAEMSYEDVLILLDELGLPKRTCKRFWTGAEMICSSCAHQLNDATANYCPSCGARVVSE